MFLSDIANLLCFKLELQILTFKTRMNKYNWMNELKILEKSLLTTIR